MQINTELEYLNSLGLHTVKPGLERISKILRHLGNPQDNFKSIIVGGTNGKGSVCSVISSILIHQGYKTGLYTSPHLIKVNERVSVNNTAISDDDLNLLIKQLRKLCNEHDTQLSYFEFITALSFIYFSYQNVDFCVLEVGMGGRWDATNVVTPLVSIITNISFDHMEYLGDTLKKIAAEKAEIIKNKVSVITACSDDTVDIIIKKAHSCSAPLHKYGTEFNSEGSSTTGFTYRDKNTELTGIKSNLKGNYQIKNISTALKAINILRYRYHFNFSENIIREALLNLRWGGRFEIIDNNKPVILDCAHNEGSSEALIESIKTHYPKTKFNFLIGMLSDKNHLNFLKNIALISDTIYITNNFSEREANTLELKAICEQLDCEYEIIDNYKIAFKKLIKEESPLCITGSIYLIGAIKELMEIR